MAVPSDESFTANEGLIHALEQLFQSGTETVPLPSTFLENGLGEIKTLDLLAPYVLGGAAKLGKSDALAHMDPPTPWITWAATLWNASLNQNLLHPATAPFAKKAESMLFDWLTRYFGMQGGHMCSGSTIANLTALWAARDSKQIDRVVASDAAHISVKKAARILALPYHEIKTNAAGELDYNKLGDVDNACLVLTVGTTATGAIDPLALCGKAKWTHVDAAWAGPLRLSDRYAKLLDGIESADSVAVSAHKWFFQPKDSALIMFKQPDLANQAISFGGGYLAEPNIGVQGSRGAAAVPLLATMLAWGRQGFARKIDGCMDLATALAARIRSLHGIELWAEPVTGVTVFRPTNMALEDFVQHLPEGMLSTCVIQGEKWMRSVAANPMADIDKIVDRIASALA